MTSTQIKINNPSSKMSQLTGIQSFSFKVVSILFLVIINITGLSSQNFFYEGSKGSAIIKQKVTYTKKATVAPRPSMPKAYLNSVRNFPILEGVSKQELHAVEVFELFDYDLIFGNAFSKITESTKIASGMSYSTNKI